MNTQTLFSSAKQDWTTPRWLFDRLDAEFHFTLDAAASPENALCPHYLTKRDDAMLREWTGRVWLNPPYSREVSGWVWKAWEAVYGVRQSADLVVLLVAARTDTGWWHQFAMHGAEIRFVRGRLKFGDGANSAPFPSAVLVFDRTKRHPVSVSALEQPKGVQR